MKLRWKVTLCVEIFDVFSFCFTSWFMQQRCVWIWGICTRSQAEWSNLVITCAECKKKKKKFLCISPDYPLPFVKVLTSAWREISFIPGCDSKTFAAKEGRKHLSFPPSSCLVSLQFSWFYHRDWSVTMMIKTLVMHFGFWIFFSAEGKDIAWKNGCY